MADFEVNFTLDPQPEIEADFNIKVGGITEHNLLSNRDLPDQHPISAITGLQEALDNIHDDYVSEAELEAALLEKQDVIRDLSEIRQGATLGATAVQPSDLVSYATESYVDSAFVPQSRTINGQSLSANVTLTASDVGATTQSYVDARLSTKQDVISDLATIRSGAALGATALQPSALNGYATQTWVGQQGYITGITSSDVTSALGYTPYDSENPDGYITSSALAPYATTSYVDSGLSGKQATLVSGTNIKTINGNSLLGSGNIEIQGGGADVEAFTAAEVQTIWNGVS